MYICYFIAYETVSVYICEMFTELARNVHVCDMVQYWFRRLIKGMFDAWARFNIGSENVGRILGYATFTNNVARL